MRQRLGGFGPLFEMMENLSDDDWVFDTGNHFNSTTALLAAFDIDLEHAFESLSPRHGSMALSGCLGLVILSTTSGPRHLGS